MIEKGKMCKIRKRKGENEYDVRRKVKGMMEKGKMERYVREKEKMNMT